MVRVLHFADAHIDMANYGRLDSESGLPLRVMDFLRSLDEIVDSAIQKKVDLVIFAGDAYKDRSPAPTFQREWGLRMMRLSNAGIPTILVMGNHDVSPRSGRASALEEYNTLEVPNIFIADRPTFYTPEQLNGLPVQIMALPWIYRSGLIAFTGMEIKDKNKVAEEMEERINGLVADWLEKADPDMPTILAAHATVQGAIYGGERTVMLGSDLVLSGSLVKNPHFDYVALGHIHKAQDLNRGGHPPVVYPGSIERVDFGEADDNKFYVIAEVEKSHSEYKWMELKHIRRFIDRYIKLKSDQDVTSQLQQALLPPEELSGAILRLTLDYPRDWETLIDEAALREITNDTFEFHLVKRPQIETRVRIPEGRAVGSMSPAELLEIYWKSSHTDPAEQEELLTIAQEIIERVHHGSD